MSIGTIESNMEARAVDQFRLQRDWLKLALFAYVRANPGATQAQAAAHINGLADQYPGHEVGIRDRVALLAVYVQEAGGWVPIKNLIATHPDWVLLKIAPEAGFPVPSRADVAVMDVVGDRRWGRARAADCTLLEEQRSTLSGLLVSQTWESVAFGLRVRVSTPWALAPEGNRDVLTGAAVSEVL